MKRTLRTNKLKKKLIILLLLLVLLGIMVYVLLSFLAMKRGDGDLSFISQFERIKKETFGDPQTTEIIQGTPEVSPLFVGDSRTLGMAMALENDIDYLDYEAVAGSGFSYFKSLDTRIRQSGADCLVIGFGVNDLNNLEKYTSYANILADDLDIPVYFLTVNPVEEQKARSHGYYIKESDISEFNAGLKSESKGYRVIDTNGYLTETGFDTMDGLHYRDNTYKSIFYFVTETIENDFR